MDQIKLKSITRGLRKVADQIENAPPLDAINYAWPLAIRAEGYLQSAAAASIPALSELLAPVERRKLTGIDRVVLTAAPLFWSIVGTWHTDERGTLQPGRIASVMAWPELSAMLRSSVFAFDSIEDRKPKRAPRGRRVSASVETEPSVQTIREATAKGIRDLSAESLRIVADLVDDAANSPTANATKQRKTASCKTANAPPPGRKRPGRPGAVRTPAQQRIESMRSEGLSFDEIDRDMIRLGELVVLGGPPRRWKKLDAKKTHKADQQARRRAAKTAKKSPKGTKTKRTK